MQKSKLKTLYIFKFLDELSDEEHPLSSSDLIELLNEKGIDCERKSIYADVEALKEIGFDIISTTMPKRGFFMASRTFELAQVRLLIDAVTFAGFITPKKTKDLVEKLETLVSASQANDLKPQFYFDASNKCDNEEIYYVIDTLNEAISKKVQVSFKYKRRNIDKTNHKSYTCKEHTVSPYGLIWKDDHYYLVCNNSKFDDLSNLRVDRMSKVVLLDEPCRPVNEVSDYEDSFDAYDYSNKMFNMFTGETMNVTLKCDLDLREEIMDRFGSKIPLTAVDCDHFETQINVAVSDGLVSWIMNFGDKIKVIEPQSLADSVTKKAKTILNLYK